MFQVFVYCGGNHVFVFSLCLVGGSGSNGVLEAGSDGALTGLEPSVLPRMTQNLPLCLSLSTAVITGRCHETLFCAVGGGPPRLCAS